METPGVNLIVSVNKNSNNSTIPHATIQRTQVTHFMNGNLVSGVKK